MNYQFEGSVSKEVLCNYLARAVTIAREWPPFNQEHVRSFILNVGAKYICRAVVCWSPSLDDYAQYPQHKEFIASVHAADPEVVFEGGVFECISHEVNKIPIPAYVFHAFGLAPEQRTFSFDAMRYRDGRWLNQWGKNTAVPDMTNLETRMFFYYRACEYIKLGCEALHLGQIHIMGEDDVGFVYWSELLAKIRAFAKENARRKFVFINAHTHGIVGADGKLLFDFHMYPSRPMAEGTVAHRPTEDNPQRAHFEAGHSDSIYGKSLGGMTHSGWECDSLPYLVELDNYDCKADVLHIPDPQDMWCWGMDEISWFANQPAWYRQEFLRYAQDFVTNKAEGDCFFAMPGNRIAFILDENDQLTIKRYYANDRSKYHGGYGDESVIKEIWSE